MAERRVISKPLQISNLREIFRRLNPDVDPAVVDFEGEVNAELTLPENRLELAEKFPVFKWFKDEVERLSVRAEAERALKEDVEFLSFAVEGLPPEVAEGSKAVIEAFERRAETLGRLRRRITALRKEREEFQRIAEARPPALEDVLRDKFEALLRIQGVEPRRFRGELDIELETVRGRSSEEQQRAVEALARDIAIREVPPPKPPVVSEEAVRRAVREELERVAVPVPAAPTPRQRRVATFPCLGPGCPELCSIDRDLELRVRITPVLKAQSPRGVRLVPLLSFPPIFYMTCDEHRLEKFGYSDIFDALGFLLAETRSSTRRLTVTKATLREVGLDEDDLREIQLREARWLGQERQTPF